MDKFSEVVKSHTDSVMSILHEIDHRIVPSDKPLFYLIFSPYLALLFYNFLLYVGKKGLNLPFSVHIRLISDISYSLAIFTKKAGN